MGPLLLFFLLFFSRFLSFLLLFIFHVFSFFVHFFFFDFLMFFIFSFFRKVYSFLFSCFLRSRCSMEMWCPDDIGRDSWDRVGPPAWGEHASTPQSGVDAPRLLKRSFSRLYYCCCCCFGVCIQRVYVRNANVCKSLRLIYMSQCLCTDPYPWRSTSEDLKEREKRRKTPKKPPPPPPNPPSC